MGSANKSATVAPATTVPPATTVASAASATAASTTSVVGNLNTRLGLRNFTGNLVVRIMRRRNGSMGALDRTQRHQTCAQRNSPRPGSIHDRLLTSLREWKPCLVNHQSDSSFKAALDIIGCWGIEFPSLGAQAVILKSETYHFQRLDLTRQAGLIVTIYDEDGLRLAAAVPCWTAAEAFAESRNIVDNKIEGPSK